MEKLIAERIKRGWTQSALARELGVSHTAVWHWEHRKYYPAVALIPRIREVLGDDVADSLAYEMAVRT